ncbi:MAG: EAL domain-containing protein, partial [Pseudomonadota bacterium]
IVGVEALARWRHPTRGVLTPDVFLPLAERLGVTAEIDRIILREGLAAQAEWTARGARTPRLSVNVSGRRLFDPALIDQILDIGVTPGAVSFEVLESVFSDRVDDAARHTLDRLEDLGVELEIDDFGTGHASLLALLALRPKRLKIARELAAPAATSAVHHNVIRAVVEIAQAMRIEVTAEGV